MAHFQDPIESCVISARVLNFLTDIFKKEIISWSDFKHICHEISREHNNGIISPEMLSAYCSAGEIIWRQIQEYILIKNSQMYILDHSYPRNYAMNDDSPVCLICMSKIVYHLCKDAQQYDELPLFLRNLSIFLFSLNDRNETQIWCLEDYRIMIEKFSKQLNYEMINECFKEMLNDNERTMKVMTIDHFKQLVYEFFTSPYDRPSRNIFGPIEINDNI